MLKDGLKVGKDGELVDVKEEKSDDVSTKLNALKEKVRKGGLKLQCSAIQFSLKRRLFVRSLIPLGILQVLSGYKGSFCSLMTRKIIKYNHYTNDDFFHH